MIEEHDPCAKERRLLIEELTRQQAYLQGQAKQVEIDHHAALERAEVTRQANEEALRVVLATLTQYQERVAAATARLEELEQDIQTIRKAAPPFGTIDYGNYHHRKMRPAMDKKDQFFMYELSPLKTAMEQFEYKEVRLARLRKSNFEERLWRALQTKTENLQALYVQPILDQISNLDQQIYEIQEMPCEQIREIYHFEVEPEPNQLFPTGTSEMPVVRAEAVDAPPMWKKSEAPATPAPVSPEATESLMGYFKKFQEQVHTIQPAIPAPSRPESDYDRDQTIADIAALLGEIPQLPADTEREIDIRTRDISIYVLHEAHDRTNVIVGLVIASRTLNSLRQFRAYRQHLRKYQYWFEENGYIYDQSNYNELVIRRVFSIATPDDCAATAAAIVKMIDSVLKAPVQDVAYEDRLIEE